MTSSAVLALDLLWPGIAAAAAAAAVLPWCKRSSVFSRELVLGVTIVLLARYIVWR